MADGAPPKPADKDKKEPVTEAPQQPVAPAIKDAAAVAPQPEIPKIVIPAISRHVPLPEVKPEAASEMKPAATETKPVETQKAETDKKPEEKKKPLKVKLFEKGIEASGFGEIWKAWKSEKNRFRNLMKSIGSKAADMIAGRIVSMTFRLIAITWVAAIIGGVSTFGGMALVALATGAASGIYTYGKDFLHDKYVGPKEKRAEVKIIDRARAKSAGMAFLSGTFNGALGAYLAKTGILQKGLHMVKDFVFSGGGLLSQHFTDSAAKVVTAPFTPDVSSAFAAAAAPAKTLPLPELAFAANAYPPAVSPVAFKQY